MKRILFSVIVVCTFGLGISQAQNWFGVRTGYPLGVTLHYGVENGLSNGFDFRVSANLRARGNSVDFGVGIDGLNVVYTDPRNPFVVYVGGGPALDFGGNSALIDIHGLVGGEFRLGDVGLRPLGIFAEISLGAGIGINRNSQIPSFGGAVGFNWHF
jgi:hypothetical protein